MSQPRYARYKHVRKVAQDAVYWVDIGRAQRMGLKFYQTRLLRSFSMTLYVQYVLKECYPGKMVKSCIQEFLKRHDLLTQLPSKLIDKQIWIKMLKHQQAAVNWRVRRNPVTLQKRTSNTKTKKTIKLFRSNPSP